MMTEEPYRWLEAVSNRREYVRDQLKGGSPVAAICRPEGILLFGLGSGQSKVFEIFDRQALAALGHPADIEKLRQAAIDAAHMEAFTRAPEDVSLRRLISFGLSPLLKNAFEQIFSAPILAEALFVELGRDEKSDLLFRLRFDGSFEVQLNGGAAVLASNRETEEKATAWLLKQNASTAQEWGNRFLELCWRISNNRDWESPALAAEVGEAMRGKILESAILKRETRSPAKYQTLPDLAWSAGGLK